jgi:tetratricopeptide (TPR) repeat protein
MCSPFRKLGVFLILLFVIGLVLTPSAFAQNRGVGGKLTDEKGEPIVKAKVTIIGVESKKVYPTDTDKNGKWAYMGLPQGSFYVVFRVPGYAATFRPATAVLGMTTIDVQLAPGDPNAKLPIEMSQEEIAKEKQEQAKYKAQQKMLGEIKPIFDAGRAAMDQNNYTGAIEQFNKALEKVPAQPTVLANLADAYFKNNQNQEALDTYQKAITVNPTDATLMVNIGVVYGKMGKIAECKAAFDKAATLDPANAAKSYFNLGAFLTNNGQAKEGAEGFRLAIKSDPNYAESYYQLGISLSGDPSTMAEAVQMLQKYLQIGKDATNIEVAKQLITVLKK